jgi:cytochrome c-type biogenesis protein CcmE
VFAREEKNISEDYEIMEQTAASENISSGRMKFILGGLLIVAAVVYLIISSTQASAQYFLTVDELAAKGASVLGRDLRISGAVIGDSIQYDPQTLNLTFTIASIPGDNKEIETQGGLAAVLHNAVTDPGRRRLTVVYNGPKPDLLRDEAQAIITGKMGEDGVFYADELLLKCPTKYEEAVPNQVEGNTSPGAP